MRWWWWWYYGQQFKNSNQLMGIKYDFTIKFNFGLYVDVQLSFSMRFLVKWSIISMKSLTFCISGMISMEKKWIYKFCLLELKTTVSALLSNLFYHLFNSGQIISALFIFKKKIDTFFFNCFYNNNKIEKRSNLLSCTL